MVKNKSLIGGVIDLCKLQSNSATIDTTASAFSASQHMWKKKKKPEDNKATDATTNSATATDNNVSSTSSDNLNKVTTPRSQNSS